MCVASINIVTRVSKKEDRASRKREGRSQASRRARACAIISVVMCVAGSQLQPYMDIARTNEDNALVDLLFLDDSIGLDPAGALRVRATC